MNTAFHILTPVMLQSYVSGKAGTARVWWSGALDSFCSGSKPNGEADPLLKIPIEPQHLVSETHNKPMLMESSTTQPGKSGKKDPTTSTA